MQTSCIAELNTTIALEDNPCIARNLLYFWQAVLPFLLGDRPIDSIESL
ncbi:hypothetical protein CKA32_002709 [Geitlerinema sp. FC II]|nr:hypothetical protein CKA32_002709 [Geitlerinema sp. FC II]